MQDVDNQEDASSSGPSSQGQSGLPAVPMALQDRQAVLARAPPDLAPALKAAADNVSNTADAQVHALLPSGHHCSLHVCSLLTQHMMDLCSLPEPHDASIHGSDSLSRLCS